MTGQETERHLQLKRLALAWSLEQGYAIGGVEVRLPHSNYRADVAAYRPMKEVRSIPGKQGGPARQMRQPVVGTTAVFECKQVRSDFLKDSHSATEMLKRLKVLEARRLTLERLLGMHEPSLRRGETLFAEYDAIDVSKYEHKTYRRVLREIAIQQARLYGKTKFDKVSRYRCANHYYLVVEEGILETHEAPVHWGLLVRRGESLHLSRMPVWQDVVEPARLELLQRIALAGSRRLFKELGILLPAADEPVDVP